MLLTNDKPHVGLKTLFWFLICTLTCQLGDIFDTEKPILFPHSRVFDMSHKWHCLSSGLPMWQLQEVTKIDWEDIALYVHWIVAIILPYSIIPVELGSYHGLVTRALTEYLQQHDARDVTKVASLSTQCATSNLLHIFTASFWLSLHSVHGDHCLPMVIKHGIMMGFDPWCSGPSISLIYSIQ